MDCEDSWSIVIDNGSKMMKAGFGGEVQPRDVFPTCVGRPRHQGIMIGMGQMDAYVGDVAWNKRGILQLKYPTRYGIVGNWDDMEKIYHHTFYNELRSAPEEYPILLTEKLNNPKANREKLTQIMFETFSVPAMYLANDAMLALYSVGKSTGISLDCGEQVCHAVPVFEGYALRSGHCQLDLGGGDLTDRMQSHLTDSGYSFITRAEKEIVRDIKEKHTFVSTATSQDEQAETKTHCEEIQYELPDGQVITVSSGTLSNCCEPLFEPWMQKWVWKKAREAIIQTTDLPIDLLSILKSYCGPGMDPGDGIHEMVFNSVIKCDEEIRQDLQSSIVLSGMTAEFPNLDERLKIEVDRLFSETPHPHQINIHPDEPGSRKYRVFLGGSMLAGSSVMDDRWITKDEYDENGPHIVHLKCF